MKQYLVLAAQTVSYHHDGTVVFVAPDARVACRWCYGRPMPGLEVCSRSSCITRYAWLQSLEVATAEDARGWHGDRP